MPGFAIRRWVPRLLAYFGVAPLHVFHRGSARLRSRTAPSGFSVQRSSPRELPGQSGGFGCRPFALSSIWLSGNGAGATRGVGSEGVEPSTSRLRGACSGPVELRSRFVPPGGFEPPTHRLKGVDDSASPRRPVAGAVRFLSFRLSIVGAPGIEPDCRSRPFTAAMAHQRASPPRTKKGHPFRSGLGVPGFWFRLPRCRPSFGPELGGIRARDHGLGVQIARAHDLAGPVGPARNR